MKKKVIASLLFSLTICVIVAVMYKEARMNIDDEPKFSLAEEQSKDFGLSNVKTISGNPVDPHLLTESEDCAKCHQNSFDEWKVSAHARSAANDPIYESHEETFAVKEIGQDGITFCAGCHTPEALVTGSVGKTKWTSSKYEQAGTSCIMCHAISDVFPDERQGIPADASYVFSPELVHEYPFANTNEAIESFLIRSAPKRHASDFSSKLYKEAEYCSSCHTQAAPNGKIEQDTYREWLNSSYADPNSSEFSTCIDCHMAPVPGERDKEVAGRTTDGGKYKKKVLDHRFVGGNQALPYLYGDQEMFKLTEKMLKSAAEIEIVDAKQENGKFDFKVKVTNKGAGHNLPTGATDLRQLWIDVEAVDENGKILFASGKLDEKMEVDPNAVMFHSKFYDEKGNLIDHHQVWRIARREDHLIPPKQSKYGEYSFTLPKNVKKITINAKLRYRVSPQYFANVTLREFGDPGTDRTLPITDMAVTKKVIQLD
ncbi:multiheme c-type cytochrome [Calidifontibacillus erzurumensis]|uniref:Cytochrome c-552/4 domain-containing protein n=1 Tax=Calidifontibacillus erzurumensis TaxID=2741433 RepID=A0A8J8GDI6_9BACI|nr:multiheme c-type cytochrome [Calidifontibacillus erzurumensis]NSL50225.1 hypothetical protein [Calidifontibacillus erzurumensis]